MSVLARTDVDPTLSVRQEYAVTMHVPDVGARTYRFLDGLTAEDEIVNRVKAYVYALAMRKIYNREVTPQQVRLDLTRTGIVP